MVVGRKAVDYLSLMMIVLMNQLGLAVDLAAGIIRLVSCIEY